MPFYLRKSLTRGPLRLNLFKSGLGASFGVTGLRIGVGSRGTYVAGGRGGLYYRQYLHGKSASSSTGGAPIDPGAATVPTAAPPTSTEYLDSGTRPANDDEVAAEISARLTGVRWSKYLLVGAIVITSWMLFRGWAVAGVFVGVGLGAAAILQASREAQFRRVEVTYDLDDAARQRYETVVMGMQAAAQSTAIWRIASQGSNRDAKYTAGADINVNRVPTRIFLNDRRIACNVPTIWFELNGGSLCLLPDRMLLLRASGALSLPYQSAQTETSLLAFRESGLVPPDATYLGTTWQYVNRNGEPDRRFANNRQIPILQYSELRFMQPQVSFMLAFSQANAAEATAKALQTLGVSGSTSRSVGGDRGGLSNQLSSQLRAVQDAAAHLKSSARSGDVRFTLSPSGPPQRIAELLRSLASQLDAAASAGTAVLALARAAAPSANAPTLDIAQSMHAFVQALGAMTPALRTLGNVSVHDPAGSSSFPSALQQFLEAAARIEQQLNVTPMATEFVPAKAAWADMIDEMLVQIEAWPQMLSAQADSIGTATTATITLVFTCDIPRFSTALANASDAIVQAVHQQVRM